MYRISSALTDTSHVLMCILPKVLGAHGLRATYGNPMPDAPGAAAHEDDPLGLDAAFDKAFTPQASAVVDDDPLGLDIAFDNKFVGADSSTEPSEVPSQVQSDDVGSDIESEQISDNSDAQGPAMDPTTRLARRMRRSPLFSRDWAKSSCSILWNGNVIGKVTAWGKNTSCHCTTHQGCRAPASTKWGSDATLELWLLDAIDETGAKRMEKAEHQQRIAALHAAATRR